MSDRRPENPTIPSDAVLDWIEVHFGHYDWETALAAVNQLLSVEALAAVRRGVESGTIKGSAINVHRLQADSALDAPLLQAPEPGTYIVIGPVSDGGSET